MKYRLLLLLLVAAIIGSTGILVQQRRSYARAVYQGNHVDEWA